MDKKLIKIIVSVIAGFIIFIIIIFIIGACSKKKLSYSDIETSMVKAAKQYYAANENKLPKNTDESTYATVTVKMKTLISEGYMEDPSETYKDDTLSCDGSVTVSNSNGYYLYSPSLTCGKDYKTQLLKDKIIDTSLVNTGVGLYESGDQYIFKGEVKDNYIKLTSDSETLYRIIRINDDGTIRVIASEGLLAQYWDDRYNTTRGNNEGINDYIANGINSRIKDSIQAYYEDSSVWPDSLKAYIVPHELCIGKRTGEDISKDGSTECQLRLANQSLGLLAAYEFMQASLSNECTSTVAIGCSNYNWLTELKGSVWTVTADADTTHKAYQVNYGLASSTCNNQKRLNVVLNLSDKIIYVSGDGTETNPYIFR